MSTQPTLPFTIKELQNPSFDVPELDEIRRSTDCEALKLWKGRSGMDLRNLRLSKLGNDRSGNKWLTKGKSSTRPNVFVAWKKRRSKFEGVKQRRSKL